MGGRGSGTWYRWDKKTTCEEVKRVDIRYLQKQGYLKTARFGTLSWSPRNASRCEGHGN